MTRKQITGTLYTLMTLRLHFMFVIFLCHCLCVSIFLSCCVCVPSYMCMCGHEVPQLSVWSVTLYPADLQCLNQHIQSLCPCCCSSHVKHPNIIFPQSNRVKPAHSGCLWGPTRFCKFKKIILVSWKRETWIISIFWITFSIHNLHVAYISSPEI